MWLMALRAFWNLSMDVMTHGTIEGGMLALKFLELCDLLSVTGETGFRNILAEHDL